MSWMMKILYKLLKSKKKEKMREREREREAKYLRGSYIYIYTPVLIEL